MRLPAVDGTRLVLPNHPTVAEEFGVHQFGPKADRWLKVKDFTYLYEEFEQLYNYRWNEEEAYKLLKCRIELEDFSGKTAKAAKQDFHAKVFLMTLCAAYAYPIEERVIKEYKADQNRKYDQKINRTNALATTMDILIPTFIRKEYRAALQAFDQLVEKTREIVRPGRSNPRNKKPKKPYSMNYKRL